MPKTSVAHAAKTNEKQIEEGISKWHIKEDIKEIKEEKAQESLSKVEGEEFAKLFQNNWNLENQLEKWEKKTWGITVIKADDEPATNTQASTQSSIKVWRNEPCPCWSWKKYKKCCW